MEKYEALRNYLNRFDSIAVAFSAGADSTFLLKVAHELLGDKCIAITAKSPGVPGVELKEGEDYCKAEGIKHIIFDSEEYNIPEYAANVQERCYYCKKYIFGKIKEIAEAEGISAVIEGTNKDDMQDYRPGLRAVQELGIISPLLECDFSKEDVRNYSKILNVPTFDKNSFSCLASRIPYGEEITPKLLGKIEAAEEVLRSLGLKQYRVRVHGGEIARIEVLPEDIEFTVREVSRRVITEKFKELGFKYVTIDLNGYRTGSLNEGIVK
ncbi:uncharacterized protein SAMN04487934_10748 [Eubacterium ruminantium]|nr:uncharacterized protein SAMN04487934_10748 [Eubacterium ruminantium]